MRCVNKQDCRNSSSSRRRILTRPLARWRERIVQTLTCSRPPTTIERLSLTPRAARKSCRQAHCSCCATRAFASLQSAPAMRATRRIRPECIGSRFFSTEICNEFFHPTSPHARSPAMLHHAAVQLLQTPGGQHTQRHSLSIDSESRGTKEFRLDENRELL